MYFKRCLGGGIGRRKGFKILRTLVRVGLSLVLGIRCSFLLEGINAFVV